MKDLLEKYARYDISYDVKDNVLYIKKGMPVKTYLQLKEDVSKLRTKVNNIRIGC